MKKLLVLVLLTGITGATFAQKKAAQSATDKTFDIPDGFLTRRFYVDLGKGNSMVIELSDMEDIDRVKNVDSLITVFLLDLAPFKDSLTDELTSKRIDYIVDGAGRKKIRIRQSKPEGSSFVLRQGEVSALKSEQDTICIIGTVNAPAKHPPHKAFGTIRYYRISFFVNDINDLKNYPGGNINEKVASIAHAPNKKWYRSEEGNWYPVKSDKIVSAKSPGGVINGTGDYLQTEFSAGIQNYKNYFVPSLSLGITAELNNGMFKRKISGLWEPNFVFVKDAAGKTKTYRNDFYTIRYEQKGVGFTAQYFHVNPNFSFSRLIKNRGGVFDKNTLRLGVGQVSLHDEGIKIEPCIYFHDLFKNITPGLKLSISF